MEYKKNLIVLLNQSNHGCKKNQRKLLDKAKEWLHWSVKNSSSYSLLTEVWTLHFTFKSSTKNISTGHQNVKLVKPHMMGKKNTLTN